MPIRAKYADKTTEGVNIDETIATMQGELVKCIKVLDLGDKDIDDMTSDEIANFVAGDYVVIKCTDGDYGFIAHYVLDIKDDEHCELHFLDSEFDTVYKAILLKEGDVWTVQSFSTALASIVDVGTKLYRHNVDKTDYSTIGGNYITLISTSNDLKTDNAVICGKVIHSGPSATGSLKTGIVISWSHLTSYSYNLTYLTADGVETANVNITTGSYTDTVTPL